MGVVQASKYSHSWIFSAANRTAHSGQEESGDTTESQVVLDLRNLKSLSRVEQPLYLVSENGSSLPGVIVNTPLSWTRSDAPEVTRNDAALSGGATTGEREHTVSRGFVRFCRFNGAWIRRVTLAFAAANAGFAQGGEGKTEVELLRRASLQHETSHRKRGVAADGPPGSAGNCNNCHVHGTSQGQ